MTAPDRKPTKLPKRKAGSATRHAADLSSAWWSNFDDQRALAERVSEVLHRLEPDADDDESSNELAS